MYKEKIRNFFNSNYRNNQYYWWKNENRYSIDKKLHTTYYSQILTEAKKYGNGKVLDIGAGEGADSIRLAKLGFEIDAVEFSPIAVNKININSKRENVSINAICCDIEKFTTINFYDIVMCNGVRHYIENKHNIMELMQKHTKIGGINCVSLFSSFSPIPTCHKIIDVFPDDENGQIETAYSEWKKLLVLYERDKIENSHDDMPQHKHSFIKLIARRIK